MSHTPARGGSMWALVPNRQCVVLILGVGEDVDHTLVAHIAPVL